MAKTPTTKPAKSGTVQTEQRQTYTVEYATALCPHAGLANNLSSTFGLNPVDAAAIRENTEELIVRGANELTDNLNEKAMQMHLQRVVGAYVASARGAGQFYSQRVSHAGDMTSRLANDDRDEDRDGPYGIEGGVARARLFVAETGLQAYALLAAAEGAVSAFAQITGETWRPYEPSRPSTQSVKRQSATAEMAAFGN
jgi:hypothetical protein